jgi:hypothetical protein
MAGSAAGHHEMSAVDYKPPVLLREAATQFPEPPDNAEHNSKLVPRQEHLSKGGFVRLGERAVELPLRLAGRRRRRRRRRADRGLKGAKEGGVSAYCAGGDKLIFVGEGAPPLVFSSLRARRAYNSSSIFWAPFGRCVHSMISGCIALPAYISQGKGGGSKDI